MSAPKFLFALALFCPSSLFFHLQSHAQDTAPIQTPVPPEQQDAQQPEKIRVTAPPPQTTKASATRTAWDNLDAGAKELKQELRINALAAIGTLNGYPKAEEMVRSALQDNARYVRFAAVAAASTMNERALIPDLQKALDDPAPEVSFAAAQTLWKLGDHSGESVLAAVLAGERKTSQSFIGSELHTANKDLHSPSTLALIGAEQGGYALLGPFGIGIDLAKMMTKGNDSPNSARVQAANLLADVKSPEVNKELIDALSDKNYFVRSSAARALGTFHNDQSAAALLAAFGDSKPLVRYMAEAAYIRSTSPQPKPETRRNRRVQKRGATQPTRK